jgi:nucleotide-binding universal stress UspA family protein
MNILVPYDGTEKTELALENSMKIARENDGLLKLLHIYWDPKVREYGKTEVRDRHSLRVLSRIKPRLERSNVPYEMLSRHDQYVSERILKTAEEEDVDLIVVSRQGFDGSSVEPEASIIQSERSVLLI